MSLKTLAWAWDQRGELTPTEKLVLLALANRCGNPVDACFPTIKPCLVEDTGLSEASIRRSLTVLEARRYLIAFEVVTWHGKSASIYVLNVFEREGREFTDYARKVAVGMDRGRIERRLRVFDPAERIRPRRPRQGRLFKTGPVPVTGPDLSPDGDPDHSG